jgi:hypothetical protein
MPQLKKITGIVEELKPLAPLVNDLVEAVQGLLKITAQAGLRIDFINGVPSISLDIVPEELAIGTLNANMEKTDIDAAITKLIFNQEGTEFEAEEDGLEDPNVADPMAAQHLLDEVTAIRKMQTGKLAMLPFTNWNIVELTSALNADSTATFKILKFDGTDSGLTGTCYSKFLNHDPIADGTRIIIIQHRESKEWVLLSADCTG